MQPQGDATPYALPDAPAPVDAAVDARADAQTATQAATTATIRGQILDYDGRTVGKMKVTLQVEAAPKVFSATITDRNGYYRFERVPPGTYRLSYQGGPKGQFTTPRTVTVKAGEELAVDILLDMVNPPRPDPNHCCKPYGAPPARRRMV